MQEYVSITDQPEFAGLKVIDTDTHWSEPPDLWTSRAPAAYKNKVPRIEQTEQGPYWVVGEEATPIQPGSPVSVISKTGEKIYGGYFYASRYGDVHEASWDCKERLKFMDALGIHAQILYPNVGGLGLTYFKSDDNTLKTLVTDIYNAAAEEIQESTGGRVLPMRVIPFWDIKAAVANVERAAKVGMKGVVLGADVHEARLPDLSDPHWYPLWEACQHHELPINFHIAGSPSGYQVLDAAAWPSRGVEATLALQSASMSFDNARAIGNLILGGVPERFPTLKFVSVESGVSWLPFYLESLDYQLTENIPHEASALTMKPSEYFKRQFYATFWFEKHLASAIDYLGADRIMFETDFPHATCLYPNPVSFLRESIGSLDNETRSQLLQNTAAAVYNIDLN